MQAAAVQGVLKSRRYSGLKVTEVPVISSHQHLALTDCSGGLAGVSVAMFLSWLPSFVELGASTDAEVYKEDVSR